MKRVLCSQAILFIRHGNTPEEREKAISQLSTGKSGEKADVLNETYIWVQKGAQTDVPDWCKGTDTWKNHKADGSLMELVVEKQVQVPKTLKKTEEEDSGLIPPPGAPKRERRT